MASFLNTDLGDLYNSWGERVAFNEGYQRQKIASARSAGAAAFVGGLDPDIARENYLQTRTFEMDLVSPDGLDVGGVEDLGAVDDLGQVVDEDGYEIDANAFFDFDEYGMAGDVLSDGGLDYYAVHGGHLRDVVDMEETWSEAHDMNFAHDMETHTRMLQSGEGGYF